MATVVPARRESTVGSDILDFAKSLVGMKIQKKQLALAEKSQALEEKKFVSDEEYRKETTKYLQEQVLTMAATRKRDEDMRNVERELAVAQASGMKKQAKSLSMQNKFLKGLEGDELKSYYLRDVLSKENQQLRTFLAGQAQQIDLIQTMSSLQQRQAEQVQKQFQDIFGPGLQEYAGTPDFAGVNFASINLFNVMNQEKADPELVKQATEAYTSVMQSASEHKTQMSLAEKQQAGEQAKETAMSESALLGLAKSEGLWYSAEDRNKLIDALANKKRIGVDFVLRSKDKNWFSVPLRSTDDKFKFVSLTDATDALRKDQEFLDAEVEVLRKQRDQRKQ